MKQVFDYKYASGSSLQTYIKGVTYRDLVEALGEPSFNEPSGDEKVQKEWIYEHNNRYFTIYDWKTFDVDYTENELTVWHVGGKSYLGALGFVEQVMKKINKTK